MVNSFENNAKIIHMVLVTSQNPVTHDNKSFREYRIDHQIKSHIDGIFEKQNIILYTNSNSNKDPFK